MKKYYLSSFLMAMMAMMCVTVFTACGGDDDLQNSIPSGDGGSSATGSTEYFEPCLDFGSSIDHVKQYMSGSVWQLAEESNEYALLYYNDKTTATVNYMFFSNKMHMVSVTYIGYSVSKADGFKAEIEKRYGITMKKQTDTSDTSLYAYSGEATINGLTVAIHMPCYEQAINIIYGLPD